MKEGSNGGSELEEKEGKKEERKKGKLKRELYSKTRKMNVIFRVLVLKFILVENAQNNILLFWVFFINFFCVFKNVFLKIVKRTRFYYFRKPKTENGLKITKRTQPYFLKLFIN